MDHENAVPAADTVPAALRRSWPVLVILLLTLVFFWPFFSGGRVFLAADTLYGFYPWRAYAASDFTPHNTLITDPVNACYAENYNRQLTEGRLWRWSPLMTMGGPATLTATQGGPGRWYPVKLLAHWLFDTPTAFTFLLLVHLFLMGAFMYLYLRRVGAGVRGALFGGVVYMLNGCTMVWLAFETVLPAGALLPLLFYLFEGFLGSRRLLCAFAGALTLGTMVVMGHFQYVLYIGMLMALFFPFLAWRAWRRAGSWRDVAAVAACFAVTGGLGLLVGSVEIFPMREAVEVSSRVSRTFTFSGLFEQLGRVPGRWWATLAFPDYFGSPVRRFNLIPGGRFQEYLNYNELTLYLGVPTLFALLATPLALRNAHARFFLALAAALAAMLMGTWLFWPFYAFFPGLDRLNPTRMIFPFVFAASIAAGFGFGALDGLDRRRRAWLGGAFVALLAAVAALALVSARPAVGRFFFGEIQKGAYEALYLSQVAAVRALSSPVILKPLLLTLAAATLFLGYLFHRGGRGWSWVLTGAIVALLGYDLISFGWYYNGAFPPEQLYPRTPAIDFLAAQPKPFRVLQDSGRGLGVNTLAPFGIEELGGYTNVYPNRVNKLLSTIAFGERVKRGAVFDRWVMFDNPVHPLYDLLNVRYVLTAPGAWITVPWYREVFRGDLAIYENTRALPRAFAVHRASVLRTLPEVLDRMTLPAFDPRAEVVLEEPPPPGFAPAGAPPPGGTVTIERYGPDEVAVRTDLSANGWVVVSNTHYPGWEAAVDGRPAPLLHADAALQAVAVPAGEHRVVFRYVPRALRRGAWLTLAGILLALGGIAGTLVAARRRGGDAVEPGARGEG